MVDIHTPQSALTKDHPRAVYYFLRSDSPDLQARYSADDPITDEGFRLRGQFGCSDEWLAEHPGWAEDCDGPEVMGRLAVELSRSNYPEGATVEVRAVSHDLHDGVIADRTWTVIGAGEPISSTEAADIVGIKRSTWRSYVARGQAPAPDYPHDAHGALTPRFPGPWWKQSTIEAWTMSRPGAGARTDLR